MPNDLTDEELKAYSETFAIFDTNGDKLISREELARAMENLGQKPSDDQLDRMMQYADSDGDGQINFDEFLTLAK